MPVLTPLKWLLGALLVCYPALVYFGLQELGPKSIAIILITVACVRSALIRDQMSLLMWLAAVAAAGFSLLDNSALGLKFYPVLMSAVMLILFSLSLYRGPSAIERLARLQDPNLPDAAVTYCAKVTRIWCLFFVLNGAIACTTVFASDALWALYNGLVSYLAMGALLGAEFLYRHFKLKHNND